VDAVPGKEGALEVGFAGKKLGGGIGHGEAQKDTKESRDKDCRIFCVFLRLFVAKSSNAQEAGLR
jgi:hypothetical protein